MPGNNCKTLVINFKWMEGYCNLQNWIGNLNAKSGNIHKEL